MGLILSGVFIILFLMVDVVWTTLTTQGSGPLTTWLVNGSRWLSSVAHRLFKKRVAILATGPLAMILLGVVWLAAMWWGWYLLFSAYPNELVAAQTGRAADDIERIYYVGFTLSTLGLGDFKPTADITKLFTVFASFNGLVLVTLVITYALPLTQGAVLRRKVAFAISLLGKTPQEIVIRASQPDNRQAFESALQTVANDLMQCTEQRLAYPMLDLFYCRQTRYSLGLQVARLDEALSLLAFGFERDSGLQSYTLLNVREVIEQYLHRAAGSQPDAGATVPPLPETGTLSDNRLSVLRAEEMGNMFEHMRDRRLGLHKLVLGEGWTWGMVERTLHSTYPRRCHR